MLMKTKSLVAAFAVLVLLPLGAVAQDSTPPPDAAPAAAAPADAAGGDPAAGEMVFRKCKVCHQIGPMAKNSVGPILNGIVGRKSGSIENFNYSSANKDSGITWDEATLKVYLTNPQAKVPGTKMAFPGLPMAQDRENVVAFLKQFDADGNKK